VISGRSTCILSLPKGENDYMVVCNMAKILQLVLPLLEEPSQDLLITIEEDLMRLIIKHGVTVSLPLVVACRRIDTPPSPTSWRGQDYRPVKHILRKRESCDLSGLKRTL